MNTRRVEENGAAEGSRQVTFQTLTKLAECFGLVMLPLGNAFLC